MPAYNTLAGFEAHCRIVLRFRDHGAKDFIIFKEICWYLCMARGSDSIESPNGLVWLGCGVLNVHWSQDAPLVERSPNVLYLVTTLVGTPVRGRSAVAVHRTGVAARRLLMGPLAILRLSVRYLCP